MAYALPGANNTYAPSFDTTGNLIVGFSRNLKNFRVNQYAQITPVKKSYGLFARFNPITNTRVQGVAGDNNAWPDGNDAPEGPVGNQEFEFVPYLTERFTEPARLGYKAVEQAAFDIKKFSVDGLGTQLMTRRTVLGLAALLNTSVYPSNHVSTATTLGGGFWSAGTIVNPIVQRTLMAAARQIEIDTASVVDYTQLSLIINPQTADSIARSAEIRDFIAQNPLVLAQIRGNEKNQNAQYGLPDQLYGMKLIVENTVLTTTNRNATTADTNYALGANQAIIVARPGDLVQDFSGRSFSTLHFFMYEEMNAEYFDDVQNRVHKMRVSDDYAAQVVSPLTGFLINNILS